MKKLMIVLALLVSVSLVKAGEPESGLDKVFFHGYDEQGGFVTGPTLCGNYLGLGVSMIPAGVAYSFMYLCGAQDSTCDAAAFNTTKGITYAFGAAVGAPFLAVKAVVWDGPMAVFDGLSPASNDDVQVNTGDKPVAGGPKNGNKQ